ncbi:hypothetical protein DWQ65_02425 [Treponema phagedenis]|uniref:hypothetical protein n=1 Tax=Treponema phagedenis TaxID=162 RepID=UPI00197DB6A8|nr:hypothetical protein [Treponema phagedenis]QSH98949.1 hypothetical protein DWQ65_02425 [Treponema phagedenis]
MAFKGRKVPTTVKVNPYEIAKASDMEFGFRSILDNFSVLLNAIGATHTPLVDEAGFNNSNELKYVGKKEKDFIIGGGLVDAGNKQLRLLPILAFNNKIGLLISDGLDKDNKPIEIEIGSGSGSFILTHQEDYLYRIESVYIGNANTGEETSGTTANIKKSDPIWDEFQTEWRGSYRVGENDTMQVSTFNKRQSQAVRLFVDFGALVPRAADASANIPDERSIWSERVKIAEVLVCFKRNETNWIYEMQPITKDDVRFVTARCYFDWRVQEEVIEKAKAADSVWVQHAKVAKPNQNAQNQKTEEKRIAGINLDNKAWRAEHYNYRWTAEHTRTYRLGSIAEINEQLYKMHKSDGDIKERVIRLDHINLRPEDPNALRAEKIPIDLVGNADIPLPYNKEIKSYDDVKKGLRAIAETLRGDLIPVGPDDGSGNSDISLPHNKKIESKENIKKGLLVIAETLIAADEKTNTVNTTLNKKIDTVNTTLNSKINRVGEVLTNHINATNVHSATSDPTAHRIAMRDGNGRMQVASTDKNSGESIVNVNFLTREWSPDFIMKVLRTKLITNQQEFDLWVGQENPNEMYTFVYLKGEFRSKQTIDLVKIGTMEVTGYPAAKISAYSERSGSYIHTGMKGDGSDRKVMNINLLSKGDEYTHYNCNLGIEKCTCINCMVDIYSSEWFHNKAIGFSESTCINCTANVRGRDGYDGNKDYSNGLDGTGAIGFYKCDSENCTATVEGGYGGKGFGGNETWSDGGNGGNGGNAIGFSYGSVSNCSVEARGGSGGDGGQGSRFSRANPKHYDAWKGGHGGNGGSAYAIYSADGNTSNVTIKESFKSQKINGGNGGDGGPSGKEIHSKKGKGANPGNGGNGGSVYTEGHWADWSPGHGGSTYIMRYKKKTKDGEIEVTYEGNVGENGACYFL